MKISPKRPGFTVYSNRKAKAPLPCWVGLDEEEGMFHRFAVGRWWKLDAAAQVEMANRLETGVLSQMSEKELGPQTIGTVYGALSSSTGVVVVGAWVSASTSIRSVQVYAQRPGWSDAFKAFEVTPLISDGQSAIAAAITHQLFQLPGLSEHDIRILDTKAWLKKADAREQLTTIRQHEIESELTETPTTDLDRVQFARLFAARAAKPR